MGIRITIGRKIGLGFGIILLLFITASILTTVTLNDSRHKNDQVTTVYNPSVAILKDLDNLLNRSKLLITKWYYVQTGDDHEDKAALRFKRRIETNILKLEQRRRGEYSSDLIVNRSNV